MFMELWILRVSCSINVKPWLHVNFARCPKFSLFHEHTKIPINCLNKGEVCWQPVVTRLFGLLTTGCNQQNVWWQPVVTSKMSGDNRLSPAKSLLTTSCIFFNNNVYPIQQHQAFNDILCYNLFFLYICMNIEIFIQKIYICVLWSNDIKETKSATITFFEFFLFSL